MIHPVRKILSNGLPVILTPNRKINSVEMAVYVKAGSMWETNGVRGISHLVEHLVLKGPGTFYSSPAFHKELERNGIMVDGLTKEEHVFFSFECHPDDIKACQELLYDTIANPCFRKKDIENEKKVIEEEYYTFKEENRVSNEIFNLMYPKEKQRFNLIGHLKEIKKMERCEIKNFHRNFFNAENMVLCVTGNFKIKTLFPYLKKTWTSLSTGYKRNLETVRPSGKKRYKFIKRNYSQQVEFDLCFPSFAWTEPEYGALRYFSRIAGESACSRVFTAVREKKGLVYDIGSSLYSLSKSGVFDIRGTCTPGNLSNILEIVSEELHKLRKNGVTKEERTVTEKILVNSVYFAQNSPSSINDFFGLWQLLGNNEKLPSLNEETEALKNVKGETIKQVAEAMFSQGKIAFVAMGPISERIEKKAKSIIEKMFC